MSRICHVSTFTSIGGVEVLLKQFFMAVRESSYFLEEMHHFLLTTSSKLEIVEQIKPYVEWYQPSGKFRYNPNKILKMAKYYQYQHIDILHSYNAYANTWAFLSRLISQQKPLLITHEHGTVWDAKGIFSFLDGLAQKNANMVIANSHASRFMLQKRYRIPEEKIRVVHNGVRIPTPITKDEARDKLGLPKDIKIVGSVGRLNTPKDFMTLIDAANRLLSKAKGVYFYLVGGGPQEDFLKKLIEEYNIADRFIMTGPQPNGSLWIAAFDLFVSTSIHESFGNVLVEASLQEKPIVAPAVDGIIDIIEHNRTGILLEPSRPVRKIKVPGASPYPRWVVIDGQVVRPKSLDPELLADTIFALIRDTEKSIFIARNARIRAEDVFNMELYIRNIYKVYSNLNE